MSGFSHVVWFILTILTGFLALPFWIICALICGGNRRKKDRELMQRQTAALEEIARIGMYKGYRG